jgi:hypothetical protein
MTARLRAAKPAISYTIPEAVEATGLGETVIKDALSSGILPKHYVQVEEDGKPISRPVILGEDLASWIRDSPTERVA